jgi:hypothetical protein
MTSVPLARPKSKSAPWVIRLGHLRETRACDNLILHSILDHARRFPGPAKALLTQNTRDFDTQEMQAALGTAGINKSFRSVANVLGWLGSIPH